MVSSPAPAGDRPEAACPPGCPRSAARKDQRQNATPCEEPRPDRHRALHARRRRRRLVVLLRPGAGGERRAAAGAAGFAVPVETAQVTVGPIERRLTAVGSLRSDESVVIRPEIAGRIAEFRFDEGEQVAQGQPLVRARRFGLARRGRAGAGRARAQPGQLRPRGRPAAAQGRHHQGARRGVRADARRPGRARARQGAARQEP